MVNCAVRRTAAKKIDKGQSYPRRIELPPGIHWYFFLLPRKQKPRKETKKTVFIAPL